MLYEPVFKYNLLFILHSTVLFIIIVYISAIYHMFNETVVWFKCFLPLINQGVVWYFVDSGFMHGIYLFNTTCFVWSR